MVPKLRGSIVSQIQELLAKSGPPVEAHAVHEHMPVMRGMAVLRGRVYGVVAARGSDKHKAIAATGLQSGRVLIRSSEDGCLYSVTDRTGAILDAMSVMEDGEQGMPVPRIAPVRSVTEYRHPSSALQMSTRPDCSPVAAIALCRSLSRAATTP
ncbi:hypothetical protein CHLRE_05g241550v5 [Chlamydomonas reinhardtii]|uniref:Uncharacterized protein n=1 Tax=Chlamydomonas reinhardtii TaxID=3055 RepID=A0A2K3DT77_CHLRE|nr:uncharacterized protein CHLRE_05g241550v5 [Chlamydomonas reinhardtii]PNW83744.1 hypothetical protein CHLRE_05g241550v5 [Chlamydomonas reinhardtii]